MPSNVDRLSVTQVWQFVIVATALMLITTAVNIQVPLFTEYAKAAGRDVGDNAQMFSMYVVGLIPTLLLFGGLSDRIGRKPTLIIAISCSFIATFSTIISPKMDTLYIARVLQGGGVALGVGTCSAYLSEITRSRFKLVSVVIAICTSVGFGTGALFTTALMSIWPGHQSTSFYILSGALFVVAILVVALCPSFRPVGGSTMRLPILRGVDLNAHLSVFIAWTVSGVVIAIIPMQLERFNLENWIGLALFLVNIMGVAMYPIVYYMNPYKGLRLGYLMIPIGYSLLIYGSVTGHIAWVLIGSSVAGTACYGFTYLSGLTITISKSVENQARRVSGYMLFAYMGFGLPTVLLGDMARHTSIALALSMLLACITLASAIFYIRLLVYGNKMVE